MNPNGPTNDPVDEVDAVIAAASDDAGADPGKASTDKGESNVSTPATTSNTEAENGGASSAGASASKAERISKQQSEQTGLVGTFTGLIVFINEALVELKKITWPDRQQVIKETLSVIVLVAIITGCVLGFDYGIAKAVFEPLDKLARHLGGGIGVHH